jgi:hypothetical protein
MHTCKTAVTVDEQSAMIALWYKNEAWLLLEQLTDTAPTD